MTTGTRPARSRARVATARRPRSRRRRRRRPPRRPETSRPGAALSGGRLPRYRGAAGASLGGVVLGSVRGRLALLPLALGLEPIGGAVVRILRRLAEPAARPLPVRGHPKPPP